MLESNDIATPYSAFPRDVTSPGPDQRPGVARSEQMKRKPQEEIKQLPPPEKGDKPPKQSAESRA